MKKDMRVIVTKRMLREGMLRCLELKPLSKITISDLCRESGINRATFYNHYETPAMILREMAYEYDRQLFSIYKPGSRKGHADDSEALEACFSFIAERKGELKVLFSDHAEQYLSSICIEIINQKVCQANADNGASNCQNEYFLKAAAAALYGFIHIWITHDIEKTPAELFKFSNQLYPILSYSTYKKPPHVASARHAAVFTAFITIFSSDIWSGRPGRGTRHSSRRPDMSPQQENRIPCRQQGALHTHRGLPDPAA